MRPEFDRASGAIVVPGARDTDARWVLVPGDPRHHDWRLVLPCGEAAARPFDSAEANAAWSRAASRSARERDAFLVALLERFEQSGDDFDRLLSLGVAVAACGDSQAELPAVHWLLDSPSPRRLDIVATLLSTAWRRDYSVAPPAEEGVALLLRACEITAWDDQAGYDLAQALDTVRRAPLDPVLLSRVKSVLAECARRLGENPAYASIVQQSGWPGADMLTVGDYDVLEPLGSSSRGGLYRGRHRGNGQEATIEFLCLDTWPDQEQAAFTHGLEVLAALDHPYLVPIWAFGMADRSPYPGLTRVLYVATPPVRDTLRERMANGPFPWWRALALVERLASALDLLHERGVLHGAFHPGHVVFLRDDNEEQPRIAGFEFVMPDDRDSFAPLDSPEYIAPEQAQGRADRRSDLYALAIIFYEMLTGKVPFCGNTVIEILMKQISEPPSLVLLRAIEVPPGAEQVLQRALGKDPGERFPSGGALIAALRALGGPTQPAPIITGTAKLQIQTTWWDGFSTQSGSHTDAPRTVAVSSGTVFELPGMGEPFQYRVELRAWDTVALLPIQQVRPQADPRSILAPSLLRVGEAMSVQSPTYDAGCAHTVTLLGVFGPDMVNVVPVPAQPQQFRISCAYGVPSAPSWSSEIMEGRFDHQTRRVAVTFTQERGCAGVVDEWRADFGDPAYQRCFAVIAATPLPLDPPLLGGGLQVVITDEVGMPRAGTPSNYAVWQDLFNTIRDRRPGRFRLPWNRW